MDLLNKNINNNSGNFENTQVSAIKFMENNIGDIKKDSIEFNNQKHLIENNTTDYLQELNYQNNIKKEHNNNNNKYNEEVSNSLRMSDYRINNSDTIINGKNISNKLIFPKTYDSYIEYLYSKSINPINTQVFVKNNIYNFDSNNSIVTTDKNIEGIKLADNSLEFTEESDILNIIFDNKNNFITENDLISLSGISNSTVTLNLKLIFENNSTLVIIDSSPNFSTKISFINVYINFQFDTDKEYFENIPIQIINKTYQINIDVFNGQLKMNFNLPIPFYSESVYNNKFEGICTMTLFNVGNYPTNLLNTGTPQTNNNILPYLNVHSSSSSGIQIKLKGLLSANNIFSTGIQDNNKFYTGTNVTLNKVYYNNNNTPSNEYYFDLGENINNVCSLSISSSEIPNVEYNITLLNNKFYWNNISESTLYCITLEQGNYSYHNLKNEMQNQISKIKRTNINNLKQYQYNIINIDFDEYNNTSYFQSYNIFNLPKSLENLKVIIDHIQYEITISHQNHNLKKGDKIFIYESLDYYYIDKKYINTLDGHIITSIINNNSYIITITNINKILYDIHNNNNKTGGYSLKIKSPNSISLDFSSNDNFGDLMGFIYTGTQFAVTPFSSSSIDYIITNKQPYAFNANDTLIFNNINIPDKIFKQIHNNYILLKLSVENNKIQVGTTETFFYKFITLNNTNKYYSNTFVDEPVVIYPPIINLSSLTLSWCYPDGTSFDFYGNKFSLSFNISNINNYPQNTNIDPHLSRI